VSEGDRLVQLTSTTDRPGLAEERSALRRIAALVAQQPSPEEVFTAVTEAVGPLLGADLSAMMVYPGVGTAVTTVAGWSAAGPMIPIGTRYSLEGEGVTARIFRTAAPARMDSYVDVEGEAADIARSFALRSTVGAPIIVDGKLWGALVAATRGAEPLPETTEERMVAFTELVATAISNVETRRNLQRIATEQEALRKAATLVASGASPTEVFAQITASASEVFGVPFASLMRFLPNGTATMVAGCQACSAYVGMSWEVPEDDPGIARTVIRTGKPTRIEDHARVAGPVGEAARSLGVGSVIGAPVVVDGAVWGVLAVGAHQDGPPLGADVGERLAGFTELVTTALSNAEAREEVRSLLNEQDTLRRVATLIARDVGPDEVFAAVCDEAVRLFDAVQAAVVRFDADEPALVTVGMSAGVAGMTIGMRSELGAWPTTTAACRTGRTARRDVTAEETTEPGQITDLIRSLGFLSTVSVPIFVEGRLWGAMTVSDSRRALAAGTERRIENFTELIATAISNREARDQLTRSEARARGLANEQAALRRVATLAARESLPVELLEAVAEEAARVLEVDAIGMIRFEPDGTATLVAQSETPWDPPPLGTAFTLDGENVVVWVHRTGRAARMDDWEHATGSVAGLATVLGVTSAVASPIAVGGRLWGTMIAATNRSEPLPTDTESRIVEFAELLATAIANAESREALRRLADEQAALRRVATLVARGASPDELFSAVAAEVAGIIDIPVVGVSRYEADGTFTVVAVSGETRFVAGSRWPVEEAGIAGMILATGRPSRWDDYSTMPGQLGSVVRQDLLGSTVGVPIIVGGSIWGFMVAAAKPGRPIPSDTEQRLVRFTELVATAVSNATTRADLLKSRARLVSTADETRRRLERDLHDGIQQWLVALALRARKAAGLSVAGQQSVQELSGLADDLVAVTDELREISRGIHPAILSDAGLNDALESLARRSAIRVELDLQLEGRYDPTLEATAYYVVAESITNAVKHAQAARVVVRGRLSDDTIQLAIEDDGVGGADPGRGTGLIGLKDRVDTLGGTITVASPAGAGTTVRVTLPTHLPLRGWDEAASMTTSG
jgi:GAF domain-containing protein/two-component sensor histidine kinase